jgi:hypothetical protein
VRCYNVWILRRKAGFSDFSPRVLDGLLMPKSSPEKLAAALRANLKRRKEVSAARPEPKPVEPAPKTAPKPAKSEG